jgi:hypothetical protein
MAWLHRSPTPCGKEGGLFPRSNDFYVPSLHVEEGRGEGRHPVDRTGYLGAPPAVFSSGLVSRLLPARVLAVAGVQAARNPTHPSRSVGDPDPLATSTDPDPSIVKQKL